MSMKKNVKKSSGGKGSPQVGAPTTYRYGQSGSKGRANMTPTRATDKK
jgi:hypothetical protein